MRGAAKQLPSGKSLRIRVFADFFKSYMSVSTVVAASIPIPVAGWKLIPAYSQQRGFLTVYASLFFFLLLAFVFSIRHRLAPLMFSSGIGSSLIAATPFVFMILTLGCILSYHATLQESIQQLRDLGIKATTGDLLRRTDLTQIPRGPALMAYYLGIFVFAESAFTLMAIREYLEDVMRLDEEGLLYGSTEPVRSSVAPQDPVEDFGAKKK